MDQFHQYYFNEAKEEKESTKEKFKIYVDQDGVLTDFKRAVWELNIGEKKLSSEKFWDTIKVKGGLEFWENMHWTADGKQLWRYINKYNPTILTSPALSNYSKKGKTAWIKRELGDNIPVIFEKDKFKYAGQNSILIDNEAENINKWIKMGDGIGILHESAEQTIQELKKYGL